MTSHFGPVNVDFLTSGRTNLKSISHDMVLSYIFFSAKSWWFFFLRRKSFKTQFYSVLTFKDEMFFLLNLKFESEFVTVAAFESAQWLSTLSIENQLNFNFNLAYTWTFSIYSTPAINLHLHDEKPLQIIIYKTVSKQRLRRYVLAHWYLMTLTRLSLEKNSLVRPSQTVS